LTAIESLSKNGGNLPKVGWREVKQRFSHIDARFIGCDIGLPHNDGFFTVELYPWWEHPLYLAARAKGENWGFANMEAASSEVTVCPKRVVQFRLSRQSEVTDWDFTQEHPLLWQYEASDIITCNSPMTVEKWLAVSEQVKNRLTGYGRQVNVAEYALRQVLRWGHSSSFALGNFPLSLFGLVCQVLDAEGIRYFVASRPKPVSLPMVFLIDNSDYIIADDFEIDVPDFVHKPEWFQPR